ncbi:MAG: heme-binding domain-containing protein [Acidobacteria bacterium]|nr:heme-binding domain-containing protein [Acidobacteriota bacterium]
MRKTLKIIVILLVIAFVAVQFYRPNKINPPIVEAEILQATTQVPENVNQILVRSCNDCHSNKTTYPWYSNISPFSWLLAEHIEEGRRELNFSVWNTYSAKKKRNKLDEVCEQVTSDAMPHKQYLWIHRDALLSAEDKKNLCDWAETEKAKIEELS